MDIKQTVIIDDRLFNIKQSSDVIEAPSKKGTKYWQGHVVTDNNETWYTTTSSWSTTKTGLSKKNWATPYLAEPKNVGRANETDNMTQAFLEFESMVKKEKDKREADRAMPMLAQSYDKHKTKIKFPCYVQPKFDGMRMLYDGTTAWSRGNKDIIPEVVQHLQFDTQGFVIDGELILPDNPKVNEVMKAAKKYREGVSNQLVYRVYDIVNDTLTFEERLNVLFEKIIPEVNNLQVLFAETHIAYTEEDLRAWHKNFTDRGFEGTMIRNMDGKYTIGQRSYDLQKFKDFVDEEFLIVDVISSGGGAAEYVGKFVCVTEEGNRFESTAMGSEEERREYLSNKDAYIGKWAKVKYRERSGATNVPFHSNVLEIRDTKDGGH